MTFPSDLEIRSSPHKPCMRRLTEREIFSRIDSGSPPPSVCQPSSVFSYSNRNSCFTRKTTVVFFTVFGDSVPFVGQGVKHISAKHPEHDGGNMSKNSFQLDGPIVTANGSFNNCCEETAEGVRRKIEPLGWYTMWNDI